MGTQEKSNDLDLQTPERRAHPRFPVDEDATLFLVNHGSRMRCHVVELSLGGYRLRTEERFLAGILIRVEVTFSVNGISLRFSGVTEWTGDRNVVGVRFVDVTSRRLDELAEVLCEVEADLAAEAAKAADVAPEPKIAAQEPINEHFAPKTATVGAVLPLVRPAKAESRAQVFLAPAHQPWSARSAGAVVSAGQPKPVPRAMIPPAKAATEPARRPVKRERRTQSRHEVDTSAVILLINVGSSLHGRILDMSLSGCRIRTDERFPVGIYTRVETEFRLEALPFRLGGVIQAVHDRDRRLVGIRFLDMSARKREQVEQLMEEIEEMEAQKGAAKNSDPENGAGKAQAL